MHSDNFEMLQVERQKLDILVDEALRNGTPLSETHEIMAQCKRIKKLAAKNRALCGEAVIAQSRKVDGILVEAEKRE